MFIVFTRRFYRIGGDTLLSVSMLASVTNARLVAGTVPIDYMRAFILHCFPLLLTR